MLKRKVKHCYIVKLLKRKVKHKQGLHFICKRTFIFGGFYLDLKKWYDEFKSIQKTIKKFTVLFHLFRKLCFINNDKNMFRRKSLYDFNFMFMQNN